MSKSKVYLGLSSFFRRYSLVVFGVMLLCVGVSLFGAAQKAGEEPLKNGERVIAVGDSSVRIWLKGESSYSISMDGKTYSRELPQQHEIKLLNHVFDPLKNPPDMPVEALSQGNGGVGLFIVQCVTQALEVYQKQITQEGGEICGTIPENALLVLMTGDVRSRVESMSFVRWVGEYLPEYKMAPTTPNSSVTRYALWLTKKNKKQNMEDFIKSIGGEIVVSSKGRRVDARLDANQLAQVIQHPYILSIDRWSEPESDMNLVREISGANFLESVRGYTGQGVRAEVCDGGIRATHQDFQANPPLFHGANTTDTSHGTSVYGIVFGSGAGDATARGLLPNAQQPIFAAYGNMTDRYAHTQQLVNPTGTYRAVFQTNSWGDARVRDYTTISAEMDDIIFDLDILILQSQSNAGTQDSRPQAWAKNILSVGGFNHYNTLAKTDDCWCTTASIGPASDGRIKPDLAHFYDYTRTTYYSSDTAYADFGGTSGATPITAGYTGLFFQMWADGVFAGGPGQNRDVFSSRPHATTAKALLIHSAYQYAFSGATADMTRVHQGWGMIDVNNLYNMAQLHGWGFPILIDESAVIAPLATHTYNLNVAGSQPLRATMVYADPAGVPGAAVQRVNDLSLKVTSPSGTIYWGNNGLLNSNWSSSGGTANRIDTVENVFIQNPEVGMWTIQVLADEVVQDGHVETPAIDADYALVVSGGETGVVTPPAAPSNLSANAAACNRINLTWTDNSDNENSFKIERSTNGTTFTEIASVALNTTSYSDTSVVASTQYWYRVRASNGGGYSNYSNTANVSTPVCPPNPPTAPSNLKATPSRNSVALSWNDNSANETGFKVYRGTTSTALSLIATLAANVTSYNDSGLARRTTYYYKVCAYNTDGESCSTVISTKTK